jgi:hypothetical protein
MDEPRLNLQAAERAERFHSRDRSDWARWWAEQCRCNHQRRTHSRGPCSVQGCSCQRHRKPRAKRKAKGKAR